MMATIPLSILRTDYFYLQRMERASRFALAAAAVAAVLLCFPRSAPARAMHLRIDPASENDAADVAEVNIDLEELTIQVFPNGTQKEETVSELVERYRMALNVLRLEKDATEDARNVTDSDSARSRRTIFGDDERLPVYNTSAHPYCATGFLDRGCTATFIGPYHALTAAHCIYDVDTDTYTIDKANMWRGRTCNDSGERMYVSHVWVVSGFVTDHKQDYDYALIKYDRPSPCWLSFGYSDNWPGIGFDIFGYPQDKSDVSGCTYESMWFTSCHYSEIIDSGRRYTFRCDILPGNSGSALYAEEKGAVSGNRVVYGVNSHEGSTWNYGNSINRDRFCQIVGWMSGSGYTPLCGSLPCCTVP